jgi:hypothetical protein
MTKPLRFTAPHADRKCQPTPQRSARLQYLYLHRTADVLHPIPNTRHHNTTIPCYRTTSLSGTGSGWHDKTRWDANKGEAVRQD